MSGKPEMRDRFYVGFQLLNKWLFLKQRGLSLSSYFTDNRIHCIGIYGMSSLGERLFDELENSPTRVLYGIDRMAKQKHFSKLPLYDLSTSLPEADALVVTPAQAFWEVTEDLKPITQIPLLSLEDIVEYCYVRARK
jgi:hypothetical protein